MRVCLCRGNKVILKVTLRGDRARERARESPGQLGVCGTMTEDDGFCGRGGSSENTRRQKGALRIMINSYIFQSFSVIVGPQDLLSSVLADKLFTCTVPCVSVEE